MKNEDYRYFLFSVVLVFSIGIAILAYFCGGEMMKCDKLKVVFFIAFIVLMICFLIAIGFLLFDTTKANSTNAQKFWYTYSDSYELPKDTEKLFFNDSISAISNPLNLENLKIVEFDSSNLEIKATSFSSCKNIKELTFYQRPKSIEKETFAHCTLLKNIYLVGNSSDWKGFEIIVPIDCEITFLPTKIVSIPKSDLKQKLENISITINNAIHLKSAHKVEKKDDAKKQNPEP